MKKTIIVIIIILSLSSCSSIKINLKREESKVKAMNAKYKYYESMPWIPLTVDAYSPYRTVTIGHIRQARKNQKKGKPPFFKEKGNRGTHI